METEDLNLVTDCLKGNGRSYDILVDKYHKIIFRLANKFVKNFDDAEEITQSVFVKAYESLNDYNPKYKFFSWLYRITVNESINFGRKKRNVEQINENQSGVDFDPSKIYDDNALGENIVDALMELEMIYRLPVVLKHFLEYSYKELSYLLNVPEKTVKSRLFTGRQLLKNLLVNRRVLQDD